MGTEGRGGGGEGGRGAGPEEVLGRVSVGEEIARGRVAAKEARLRSGFMAFLEGCRRTRAMGGGVASSIDEPGLGGGWG